jgi:hypothetical protein
VKPLSGVPSTEHKNSPETNYRPIVFTVQAAQRRFGFPMCDKCAKLDKKIEHYETMLVSIGDRGIVERLMALVAELQAQKRAFHPGQ